MAPEKANDDLKFNTISSFSDDELIGELSNRFSHFILAGRKDNYQISGHCMRRRYFEGDHEVCLGLAARIVEAVHDAMEEPDLSDEEHSEDY